MKNFYHDLEDNDGYISTYYIVLISPEVYLLQAVGNEDWFSMGRTISNSNWERAFYNDNVLGALHDDQCYFKVISDEIVRRGKQ